MENKTLARLAADRRCRGRREPTAQRVLMTQQTFDRLERMIWKALDRRQQLRRAQDIKVRIAQLD
jgi:hypothetical protein